MKTMNPKEEVERHAALQWIEQSIKRIVIRLNIQLARCSMTWQVVICLVVVVCLAFANASILWQALHENPQQKISIQAIPFSPALPTESNSVLTHAEYNKLIMFNKMLDSLRNSPSGRSIYNELMHSHPGIRDSIDFLLKHYPPEK